MAEVLQTPTFRKWWRQLKDAKSRGLIIARLDRLAQGQPGDVAPIGDGLSELRVHYGPGYRIYFKMRGDTPIILLCGGDKSTQARDIDTAKRLAKAWSD